MQQMERFVQHVRSEEERTKHLQREADERKRREADILKYEADVEIENRRREAFKAEMLKRLEDARLQRLGNEATERKLRENAVAEYYAQQPAKLSDARAQAAAPVVATSKSGKQGKAGKR